MRGSLVLAGVVLASRANGPGVRDVYWTAGCNLRCPGCQNEHLWSAGAGRPVPVDEVAAFMRSRQGRVDGVTFSGGEPVDQPQALSSLVAAARGLGFSVVLFTGRTWEQCQADVLLRDTVEQCDLVVAGPFVRGLATGGHPLLASSNQVLAFPTGRYSEADLQAVPETEVLLGREGMVVTGVPKVPLG